MCYRCLVYHSWRGKVLEGVELRICHTNTAPHLANPPTWDALGTQNARITRRAARPAFHLESRWRVQDPQVCH